MGDSDQEMPLYVALFFNHLIWRTSLYSPLDLQTQALNVLVNCGRTDDEVCDIEIQLLPSTYGQVYFYDL